MMSGGKTFAPLLLLLIMLSGCSSMESLPEVPTADASAEVAPYSIDTHQRSIHLFDPISLTARIDRQRLTPRVTQLFVLVDESLPDDAVYRQYPLDAYTREMYRRFNRTVPEMDLSGWSFALRDGQRRTDLPEGARYDARQIEQTLNAGQTLTSIGTDDLAEAIDALSVRAHTGKGNVALVILTSWDRIDRSVVEAAQRFRQRMRARSGFWVGYVQRVLPESTPHETQPWQDDEARTGCIFMLGVGNRLSRTTLDELDQCGFSEAADKVAQPRDMSHFVERILFNGPADSDGDGIYDYKDRCPGTERGRLVRFDGCLRFASTAAEGEN